MTGKNDPFRSFGIRSSTSPAWVASNRSRAPLRSVVRDSVRSYLAAPIRSVASASISSCMTIRTGLLRHDVDFQNRTVTLSRPRVVVAGRAEESETKTRSGERSLALDPDTLDGLQD